MSTQHIMLEDMLKMIYARRLDGELTALATRVNRHLFLCPHCQKVYADLLHIRDTVDNSRGQSINVVEKRDLELFYDNRLCRENDYVLLLDEKNEIRYAERATADDGGRMRASFKDVSPDEYFAVLASDEGDDLPTRR